MNHWNEPEPELDQYRRLRDAYTTLVSYGEMYEHMEKLWMDERRRSNALLEEAREIRMKVQSVGTMTGSIPVSSLGGLLELLEQHDREMEMPF